MTCQAFLAGFAAMASLELGATCGPHVERQKVWLPRMGNTGNIMGTA